MEASAKLIAAIGTLLAALAWPTVFAVGILVFRTELKAALAKIPAVVDRMKAVKIGALEAELDKIADQSSALPEAERGLVSVEEVKAAARIEASAESVGETELLAQLDRLCIEYDTTRRVMQSGSRRTNAMTQILVRMRALGPSVIDRIDVYKSSGSPGSRLAAIAMMQMQPDKADLPWLVRRFDEDQPFVFYHAALALQNAANSADYGNLKAVKKAAQESLAKINLHPGVADSDSIHVLQAIISDKISGHYS